MTTEELIKALREKPSRDNRKFLDEVANCVEMLQNAIFALNEELIAQKAEVEKLTKVNAMLFQNADTAYQEGLNEAQALYACEVRGRVRAEAVKEFAKRLKQEMEDFARIDFNGSTYYGIGLHHIDNLVKEFTEGKTDE